MIIRLFELVDPTQFDKAAEIINEAWREYKQGDMKAAYSLQNEFVDFIEMTRAEVLSNRDYSNNDVNKIDSEDEPFSIRKMGGLEDSTTGHIRVLYIPGSKLFDFMQALLENLKDNSILEEPEFDNINPSHYRKGNLEAIDVIETFTEDLQGVEATDTGNILKYVMRWKNKNGVEDLKKARWYLEHLINKLEGGVQNGD